MGEYFAVLLLVAAYVVGQGQAAVPPKPKVTFLNLNRKAVDSFKEGQRGHVLCTFDKRSQATAVRIILYFDEKKEEDCRPTASALGKDVTECAAANHTFKREENQKEWSCTTKWQGNAYESGPTAVNVEFLPNKVVMSSLPETVKRGEKVTLSCAIDSANPPVSIVWRRDKKPINKKSTGFKVDAQRVQKAKDYNGMSTSSKMSFVVVQEDDGAKFDCAVYYNGRVYKTSKASRVNIETIGGKSYASTAVDRPMFGMDAIIGVSVAAGFLGIVLLIVLIFVCRIQRGPPRTMTKNLIPNVQSTPTSPSH